jgi:fructose-bisphosphate aldolase class II
MSAADEVGAPVILQASAGARKYAGEPFIKHLIQAAAEMYPHIPLVMHQDHGTTPEVCQAPNLGFGSVMMDGSLMEDGKTPSSFDYNVDVTQQGGGHGPQDRRHRGRRAGLPGQPGNRRCR